VTAEKGREADEGENGEKRERTDGETEGEGGGEVRDVSSRWRRGVEGGAQKGSAGKKESSEWRGEKGRVCMGKF